MSEENPIQPSGAERRDFYRINDAVALQVEPIEDGMLSEYEASFDADRMRFGLVNYFSHCDEKLLPKRRKIESKSPDLADYLSELEGRIELLARLLVDQEESDIGPSHVVNISGSGIDFGHHLPLATGSYALLRIQLFPEQIRIMAIGQVMHAGHDVDTQPSDAERGEFRAGMHFVRIHDEDRERLIKHIHGLQMEHLRFQRG